MSGDEVLVFGFAAWVAIAAWWRPARASVRVERLRPPTVSRIATGLAPALVLLALGGFVAEAAASDVVGSYVAMYAVLGAAWVGAFVAWAMRGMGVDAALDVVENDNRAAFVTLLGATIGASAAYAGGNVGEGPGWWCVVFAGALPTLSLALAWMALAKVGAAAEKITIDRDLAAGLRAAALLVSVGVIGGAAAAGDWIGAAETVRDFAMRGWPILPLVLVAAALERREPAEPIGNVATLVRSAIYAAAELGVAAFVVGLRATA